MTIPTNTLLVLWLAGDGNRMKNKQYDGKINWSSIFDEMNLPDPAQEFEEDFRKERAKIMSDRLYRSQERNHIVH